MSTETLARLIGRYAPEASVTDPLSTPERKARYERRQEEANEAATPFTGVAYLQGAAAACYRPTG